MKIILKKKLKKSYIQDVQKKKNNTDKDLKSLLKFVLVKGTGLIPTVYSFGNFEYVNRTRTG